MSRLAYVLVALAALCLPSCGGSGGGRVSPSSVKYRIALIPKGETHQFWQSIRRGAEAAAAHLTSLGIAVEVAWDAPLREDNAGEQIHLIDRNVGRGVSGIVLAPQHSKQMIRPVEDSVKAGIPVVVIDSGLDNGELDKNPALMVKYVATDNYNGGKLAAEHLLKVLKAQGKSSPKVLLFPYQPGSESTEQREKGFLDHIASVMESQKKKGEPPVQLVTHQEYSGATVETAEKAANPLLTRFRNEEIDGIFAVNESAATGMLNAMRSQGLQKKILLMGFDSSEPLLQALAEDDVIGLIVQDPYRMGYLGLWHCVRHLEGDNVTSDGKREMSTGEYVMTKENLKTTSSRELFDPELQKQRKIDTPTYQKRAK